MLIQFFPPLVANIDRLINLGLICSRIALVIGVFHEQAHILGLLRVENVPEVATFRHSSLGEGIRKVTTNLIVLLHHRPD